MQVHSREAAAAAAGRELAEAEAEGRRRDEQGREGAARSAEEHVLRNALRRAVAAAERQVLSGQGALSARLAQLEPRLWAAEDRVACVSRFASSPTAAQGQCWRAVKSLGSQRACMLVCVPP